MDELRPSPRVYLGLSEKLHAGQLRKLGYKLDRGSNVTKVKPDSPLDDA